MEAAYVTNSLLESSSEEGERKQELERAVQEGRAEDKG